jgi:2,3,4,5-tetrahydropyridine-2-carboxylate N-succinyltransferase
MEAHSAHPAPPRKEPIVTVTALSAITSTKDFKDLADRVRNLGKYPGDPNAFGLALATVHVPSGTIVEHRFIQTNVMENFGTAALFWLAMTNSSDEDMVPGEIDRARLLDLEKAFKPYRPEILKDPSTHLNIQAFDKIYRKSKDGPRVGNRHIEYRYAVVLVRTTDFTKAPQNAGEVYLPLYLLSQCKAEVNSINLDGTFGLLPNVIHTKSGPVIELDAWDLFVEDIGDSDAIDKIPPLLRHVIPKGVRHNGRARLGARLDPKTTTMHASFVNFNAGTSGILDGVDEEDRIGVMLEGRVSQGVIVYDGADIGGGASTAGTLSGGGTQRVSVGYRTLISANAGVGFPIGPDCIVEAGLYLTPGTKVLMPDGIHIEKAENLAGKPNLMFIRHSQDGLVQALPTKGNKPELNPALHSNN